MQSYKEMIERCLYNAPIALTTIKEPSAITYIKELLPYSVGFEIECHPKEGYDYQSFRRIPFIMDSPGQFEAYEFRFRIPYGINGALCLFAISIQASINLKLNEGSGIHYHGDMTDVWDEIERKGTKETYQPLFIEEIEKAGLVETILTELDTWKYRGHYARKVGVGKGYWMGIRSGHRTMEFRTGNMTFDYKELINRVISVNKCIRLLKDFVIGQEVVNQMIVDKEDKVDYQIWIDYFNSEGAFGNYSKKKKELEKLKQDLHQSYKQFKENKEPKGLTMDEINQRIKSRIK